MSKTAEERLSICLSCPYISDTERKIGRVNLGKQCTICKCFMKFKTKIPAAKCADKDNPRW